MQHGRRGAAGLRVGLRIRAEAGAAAAAAAAARGVSRKGPLVAVLLAAAAAEARIRAVGGDVPLDAAFVADVLGALVEVVALEAALRLGLGLG